LVVTTALDRKRFDPSLHPRDHEGQFAEVPGSGAVRNALDKLNLAGRIDLDDGEELLSSGKVNSETGAVRVAVTRRDGQPSIRFAADVSDAGLPKWSGNKPRTADIHAERERIDAERDLLDEDDPRYDELTEQLAALGEGDDWSTARLDPATADQLRTQLRDALAAAGEAEKAEKKRFGEVDRLERERDKLRHMGRVWTDEEDARWDSLTAQIGALESEFKGFDAQGVVAGEWGDIHYNVYFEELDSGPTAAIGVKPHGVGPDWEDGRDWKGAFNAAELRRVLKLLGEDSGKSRRLALDEVAESMRSGSKRSSRKRVYVRDSEGQFAEVPDVIGAVSSLLNFDPNEWEHSVQIEGSYGPLGLGRHTTGDVRLAWVDSSGAQRDADLGDTEIEEMADQINAMVDERDAAIADPDLGGDDVVDYLDFGYDDAHRVELRGNGLIVVKIGEGDATEEDPAWELILDPPHQVGDETQDDTTDLVNAVDGVLQEDDDDAPALVVEAGQVQYPDGRYLDWSARTSDGRFRFDVANENSEGPPLFDLTPDDLRNLRDALTTALTNPATDPGVLYQPGDDDEGWFFDWSTRRGEGTDTVYGLEVGHAGDAAVMDMTYEDMQHLRDALSMTLQQDEATKGRGKTAGRRDRMSTKQFGRIEIKNAAKGEVTAVIATLDRIDSDDDGYEPGAFHDNEAVAISAWGHKSWEGALPVGAGRIDEVGNEAIFTGQFFLDTTHGLDHFRTVKQLKDQGIDVEWSFGYDVLDEGPGGWKSNGRTARRTLRRLAVHEVSPLLKGAGVNTRTLSAKSARTSTRTAPSGRTSMPTYKALRPHGTATTAGTWDPAGVTAAIPGDVTIADLRSMHGWCDGDPERKASYRFLHHDVPGGPANVKACLVGIARLNTSRGETVPSEDRAGVYEHLAGHLRDAGREPPGLKAADSRGARTLGDIVVDALLSVGDAIDAATRAHAQKAGRGKQLTVVSAELLEWLGSDLGRLRSLVDSPNEDALKELARFIAHQNKTLTG
jgi:hypothetical protein